MGGRSAAEGDALAGVVDQLVERIATVRWDDLDAVTQDATLRAVYDALGIASGGSIAPGVPQSLDAFAIAGGQGDVAVPWTDLSLPPADAAMALSLLIHAWDFDDTHDAAVVHACTVSIPAAYATALRTGASGRAFLEGTVAGIETVLRMSLLLGAQHGVIRTAGLGALGAAAATARVLGLDAVGVASALSLATPATMSPTSRQVVEDGAITKRHQPGFALRHGVTAGFLAQAGVSGAEGWFAGSYGLGALIPRTDEALERAGQPGWEVTRMSLKPFPACRYTHAAISGTVSLLTDAVLPVSATVHVPSGPAHVLVARPWARRGMPVIDAQFSIPWLVGAAMVHRRVDLELISGPILMDPAIEVAASAVEVVQDLTGDASGMTPVRIELKMADGSTRTSTILDCPGSPTRPLDWEMITAKVAGCARAAGRPEGDVDRLRDWVQHVAVSTTLDPLPGAALVVV